jgi:SAM-dependent methyltransferase
MTDPSIIGAYDAIAPLYQEYSNQRQAYLDAVDELVIENLNAHNRLLDIGSGDGRRLAKISQRVGLRDIVAVEPSAEMAKLCENNVGVPVYQEFGENIDRLDIGEFDVATALWNIFGHIPNAPVRLQTLVNIRARLKSGGKLILDVNNRHNALAYGRWAVLGRAVIDTFNFKESRGDAHYEWKIGEQTFNASGHLFTPAEIEKLFDSAGFKVSNRYSVNYASGEISASKYRGQLFYILKNGN